MQEIVTIAVIVVIIAILIKVGLKILKWGLIIVLLYALWRFGAIYITHFFHH